MDLDELKRRLQAHFTDGLATVIGSGLSAAVGLPGMWHLEQHLRSEMPNRISSEFNSHWKAIDDRLAIGGGLEVALQEIMPPPEVEKHIIELTATLIEQKESDVIKKVVEGSISLPFARLLPQMTISPSAPIVTSNYDRLIEVAADIAGYGVDTMFIGNIYGRFNPDLSKKSFVEEVRNRPSAAVAAKVNYRKHLKLFKPHGSLDWFELDGTPVRCPLQLSLQRMIITPGINKYQKGYEQVFDTHRQHANQAIVAATQYLVIGYGFNDRHLETSLRPQIEKGKPCVILARELTDSARKLVEKCHHIIAISLFNAPGKPEGTMLTYGGGEFIFPGVHLWDLDAFIREVFQA